MKIFRFYSLVVIRATFKNVGSSLITRMAKNQLDVLLVDGDFNIFKFDNCLERVLDTLYDSQISRPAGKKEDGVFAKFRLDSKSDFASYSVYQCNLLKKYHESTTGYLCNDWPGRIGKKPGSGEDQVIREVFCVYKVISGKGVLDGSMHVVLMAKKNYQRLGRLSKTEELGGGSIKIGEITLKPIDYSKPTGQ